MENGGRAFSRPAPARNLELHQTLDRLLHDHAEHVFIADAGVLSFEAFDVGDELTAGLSSAFACCNPLFDNGLCDCLPARLLLIGKLDELDTVRFVDAESFLVKISAGSLNDRSDSGLLEVIERLL